MKTTYLFAPYIELPPDSNPPIKLVNTMHGQNEVAMNRTLKLFQEGTTSRVGRSLASPAGFEPAFTP